MATSGRGSWSSVLTASSTRADRVCLPTLTSDKMIPRPPTPVCQVVENKSLFCANCLTLCMSACKVPLYLCYIPGILPLSFCALLYFVVLGCTGEMGYVSAATAQHYTGDGTDPRHLYGTPPTAHSVLHTLSDVIYM